MIDYWCIKCGKNKVPANGGTCQACLAKLEKRKQTKKPKKQYVYAVSTKAIPRDATIYSSVAKAEICQTNRAVNHEACVLTRCEVF